MGTGSFVYSIKREEAERLLTFWGSGLKQLSPSRSEFRRSDVTPKTLRTAHFSLGRERPTVFPVMYFVSWEDKRKRSGEDKFWKPSKASIYYFKRGPVNWRFTKKLERGCDFYIVLGIYTHGWVLNCCNISRFVIFVIPFVTLNWLTAKSLKSERLCACYGATTRREHREIVFYLQLRLWEKNLKG